MTELIDAVVEQTEKRFAANLAELREWLERLDKHLYNTEDRLANRIACRIDDLRKDARESGQRIEMRIATIEHQLDQILHGLGKFEAKIEPPPPEDPTLAMPVAELELSIRSVNCLSVNEIKTVGDLVKMSNVELLRTPNFGRRSLREVEEVLRCMGLSLRPHGD